MLYNDNHMETPKLTKKHLKILQNSQLDIQNADSIDSLLENKNNIITDVSFSETTNVEYIKLRKHISYSEISTWMDCAYRHKLKYLDEIKTDKDGPSVHTEFGQAIHDALEIYITTRVMPPISQVQDQILELFKVLPDFDKIKMSDWLDVVEPILSEVPEYMENVFGKDWEFVAAEYPLMEQIDKHEHMFKGFIDGVIKGTNKKGEKQFVFIDWKSCGYFWPLAKRTDPKKTMQLAFYKYFYCKKYNIPLKDTKCGFFLLRRSKKTGNCEWVVVSVGEKAVEKALGTIDNMLGYIQKRMFPKDRSSCTYCQFSGTEHCK